MMFLETAVFKALPLVLHACLMTFQRMRVLHLYGTIFLVHDCTLAHHHTEFWLHYEVATNTNCYQHELYDFAIITNPPR